MPQGSRKLQKLHSRIQSFTRYGLISYVTSYIKKKKQKSYFSRVVKLEKFAIRINRSIETTRANPTIHKIRSILLWCHTQKTPTFVKSRIDEKLLPWLTNETLASIKDYPNFWCSLCALFLNFFCDFIYKDIWNHRRNWLVSHELLNSAKLFPYFSGSLRQNLFNDTILDDILI